MNPKEYLKENKDNEYIWLGGREAFVVKRHGYSKTYENIEEQEAVPIRCYAYEDDKVFPKRMSTNIT